MTFVRRRTIFPLMLNKNHALSVIGAIRKKANAFIEKKLCEKGIDDLLLPHGTILSVLYKSKKPLKISEITEKSSRTKSTVTELIKKLEKNGYVTKTPDDDDMRVSYVALTEKARTLEPVFKSISEKMLTAFFRDFTQNEISVYMALNQKILNNLE